MIYRDDDVGFLTNRDELERFHAAFEKFRFPHTVGLLCAQMEENHAVNNFIKGRRIFDLQVHGWTHRDYAQCSEEETFEDLMRCKEFMRWKFGVTPRYFYPPWNVDSQAARRAAARAGLRFDNRRVEANDYLARGTLGAADETVNLHYWQDLDKIEQILEREWNALSAARRQFHAVLWELEGRWMRVGGRCLMVGKTHTFQYERWMPRSTFETVDIDAHTQPTYVGDIQAGWIVGEPYDAVLLFGVYEQLSDPRAAITNCERMVRDGGTLVIGAARAPRSSGGTFYAGALEGLSEFRLVEEYDGLGGDYGIGVFRKG